MLLAIRQGSHESCVSKLIDHLDKNEFLSYSIYICTCISMLRKMIKVDTNYQWTYCFKLNNTLIQLEKHLHQQLSTYS